MWFDDEKDESRSGDYKQQLRPEADPRLHSLRLSQAWGLEVVLVKVMIQRRKQRKMKMVRLGKKLVGWVFYSFSSAQHWPGKFDSFFWWQRVRQDRTGWEDEDALWWSEVFTGNDKMLWKTRNCNANLNKFNWVNASLGGSDIKQNCHNESWWFDPSGLASVGTELLTRVRQGRYLRWEPKNLKWAGGEIWYHISFAPRSSGFESPRVHHLYPYSWFAPTDLGTPFCK